MEYINEKEILKNIILKTGNEKSKKSRRSSMENNQQN